jgi:glycosyltransferase involved in cell wall biosynthesis
MRIALISEIPGPRQAPEDDDDYPAGPARQVSALASALARLDTEVTVYAPPAARPGPGSSAPPSPAPGSPAAAAPGPASPGAAPDLRVFAEQLAQRWRREAPDVVHAQSWAAGVAALAGARGLNLPTVQTFRSVPTPARRRRGPGADPTRVELALARAVRAVLVSTSDAGSALCRLGIPRAAIRVVPCGVDTDRFTPAGPAAERDARPRLLMVAGLADDPGPATALRALADVPGAELVIAGGPPAGQLAEDPGYQALARLAGQLGVADRVSFTGRVGKADMPALMRSADLLLNLGAEEPQAMVTVDAMACGVPVVAAGTGLHADAVIDGTTGLLVRSAAPALLARRVRQLLASPMLEGMAIAAASRAADRYSWARISQETLAVYERAAQPRTVG